jgi:hypothetical protein
MNLFFIFTANIHTNMKKLSTLFFLLALCVTAMKGQDMITKKDGSIIKAKITEVNEDNLKYKKADNPDGPSYTIAKDNIFSVTYANGQVEKFTTAESTAESESKEETESGTNPILENEALKRTIEGISKDVGEQLIRNCANGKVDNSTTEIYWDGVLKDAITGEIIIPIKSSWKPKWTDGSGKWIKGKIVVATDGTKKWVYQNDNGLVFSSCAKTFRIK